MRDERKEGREMKDRVRDGRGGGDGLAYLGESGRAAAAADKARGDNMDQLEAASVYLGYRS